MGNLCLPYACVRTQDLRSEDTPHESGLSFVCKLKKDTPFLGRDVVEKQKAEGVRKKRACFTIEE